MNVNKLIISTVLLLMLFTSCQQEELSNTEKDTSQSLHIAPSIENAFVTTRSFPMGTTAEQGQFKEGDEIGVTCSDAFNYSLNKTSAVFKKVGSEWVPVDGKELTWPIGAEKVAVEAYYPVKHSNEKDGSNNASWATFILPCDQTGSSADNNIEWADRMISQQIISRPKDNTIPINMQRQTAKVNIRVTKLDPQWDPDQAWVSIDYVKAQVRNNSVGCEDNLKLYPANGKQLFLNNGEATCLLIPALNPTGNKTEFCTISVYSVRGSVTEKTTLKVLGFPNFTRGNSYTLNLNIGKAHAEIEQFSIEPWGEKFSLTDAVGEFLPVMIVRDGLAHIYLDRAKAANPMQQIKDSIQSAENKHKVHDLVFYGNTAGKLTLDNSAGNMIKYTNVRSLDLSHVTDLTEIKPYSFRSQDYSTEFSKLEEVYLPESVTKIGQSAFEGSLIQKITTPGVEALGEAAFKNCKKLKSITLNKLTGILPSYSFENCIEMASAYMPKITEIAEYAFRSASLKEGIQGHVDFSSVTYIHSYAFESCRITGGEYDGDVPMGICAINELTFPKVIQIDDRAFSRCRNLFAISFPKANRLGDYIFSGCMNLATIMFTVKGTIAYIGAKKEPFSRDISTFPETDNLMVDYHSNKADYLYGIGTIIVHEDKMYGRSNLSPRVTDYRSYIGYADDRGRAQFGLVGKASPWWQDVVYVNDAGKKYLGVH